jgi:transposase
MAVFDPGFVRQVILRRWAGFRDREIAQTLGVSKRTLYRRLAEYEHDRREWLRPLCRCGCGRPLPGHNPKRTWHSHTCRQRGYRQRQREAAREAVRAATRQKRPSG